MIRETTELSNRKRLLNKHVRENLFTGLKPINKPINQYSSSTCMKQILFSLLVLPLFPTSERLLTSNLRGNRSFLFLIALKYFICQVVAELGNQQN